MSAPCGKSKQSPETIATFKKLKLQTANKTCFDCPTKNPTWASIPFGVFLCLNCSGNHRSLGTHISFVRSIQLDDWTPEQLAKMVHGGNQKAREFFKARGGMLTVAGGNLEDKYTSPCANMYKTQLEREAKKGIGHLGLTAEVETPSPNTPISSTADDFFGEWGDEDSKQSPSITRSTSAGNVSRITAPPTVGRSASAESVQSVQSQQQAAPQAMANIQEIVKTEMMMEEMDDWAPPAATSPAPAAADDNWGASDASPKVISAKKTSSIGKKGAKKPQAVKVKPTAVKVGGSSGSAKASKADNWGDMDSFDDAKWESIKNTAAKAEADASKPKELVFEAPPAHSSAPIAAAKPPPSWDEPTSPEEPGLVLVDKNFNKGKKIMAQKAAEKAAKEAASYTPMDQQSRQKYAAATSISSEQFFHGDDDGVEKNYQQFSGQRSLGSDQYFGRGSQEGDDYGLAEETRRDFRVVSDLLKDKGRAAAAMAGDLVNGLSERYFRDA